MNVVISLLRNSGFKWHNNEHLYVKGYIYDENNSIIKGSELLSYLNLYSDNKEIFTERIKKLNGSFSCILKSTKEVILFVDIKLSFQLFYYKNSHDLFISDELESLQKMTGSVINSDMIEEFLQLGYVSGRDTIFNNINQTRAGEIVTISDTSSIINDYFNYLRPDIEYKDFETCQNDYQTLIRNIGNRLINGLQNKTIVLCLSGGLDSRLIAAILKIVGYDDVICLSYGSKDSYEVPIAGRVAKKLGFKWIFVEYSKDLLENYLRKDEFTEFVKYSSNMNSRPHIQDYFALKFLLDQGEIGDNMIFTNGILGEYKGIKNLSYPKILSKMDNNKSFNLLFQNKFGKSKLNQNFIDKYNRLQINGKVFEQHDNWILKKYKPRFIYNCMKAFEFLGFEHRTPLLDRELIEFYFNLLPEYRFNYNFYHSESKRTFFKQAGIDFTNSAYPKLKQSDILNIINKTKIFRILNDKLGKFITRKYNDPNNFKYVIQSLYPEYSKKGNTNQWYNGNITKWYIENFILKHYK